jgi:hypothetical protein
MFFPPKPTLVPFQSPLVGVEPAEVQDAPIAPMPMSLASSGPDSPPAADDGAGAAHAIPKPDTVQVDIQSDEPAQNSFEGFLIQVAVLSGDATEKALLQSIWRLQRICEARLPVMSKISNPKFIGRKLKDTVNTLKVIARGAQYILPAPPKFLPHLKRYHGASKTERAPGCCRASRQWLR